MESNDQNTNFTLSFSKESVMNALVAINLGLLIVFGFQIVDIKQELGGGAAKSFKVADAANAPSQPAQVAQEGGDVEPVGSSDYIKGNEDAVISIIEYSDFECPFCERFHATAQQAVDAYEGRVNWVYRHFPLNIHPTAAKKAEAAECAGKLAGAEGFWNFTDALFEAGTSYPLNDLASIAGRVGISEAKFQTCLDSGEMQAEVDKDFASGQTAGVTGTPGNFIYNNETGESIFIPGALPFQQVQAAINQLL